MKRTYEKQIQDAKEVLTRVECERRELHLANGNILSWDGCKQRFLIQMGKHGINWIDRQTAIEEVCSSTKEWRLW